MPVLRSAVGARGVDIRERTSALEEVDGAAQPSLAMMHPHRKSEPPAGLRSWLAEGRGVLAVCTNPGCSSGWLHLWRSRGAPIFEQGWTCSAACTGARLDAAIRRELDGRALGYGARAGSEEMDGELTVRGARMAEPRPHRIPLGLVMLEQGWITQMQLRNALEAQREAGRGRLGRWLVRQQSASEVLVARTVALQWGCPVLSESHRSPDAMAAALPRLFIEGFGALPLRVAGNEILYLAFAGRLDPVVALAMQRMLGMQIETGILPDSQFQAAQQRMLHVSFPGVDLVEARSESVLVRMLTKKIEATRPVEARLVRVHDCLWLRMWLRPQGKPLPAISEVQDVICSLAGN